MSRCLVLVAALFLAPCSSAIPTATDRAGASKDATAAKAPAGNGAAATMSLVGTTWEFADDGVPTVVTIDPAGRYIEERADGTYVVHGTYAQRDGKDCFTPAMATRRPSCWSAVPPTGIGESASSTHDKGWSADFRRVAYRPLKEPAEQPGLARVGSADARAVAATVEEFHAFLAAGKPDAAAGLLAPDAVVFEGGERETREEYIGHHLLEDMKFAKAVPSTRSQATITVVGDVAWASATSVTQGTYQSKPLDLVGAELMVLTRTSSGWRIRAIHWSSRKRK